MEEAAGRSCADFSLNWTEHKSQTGISEPYWPLLLIFHVRTKSVGMLFPKGLERKKLIDGNH